MQRINGQDSFLCRNDWLHRILVLAIESSGTWDKTHCSYQITGLTVKSKTGPLRTLRTFSGAVLLLAVHVTSWLKLWNPSPKDETDFIRSHRRKLPQSSGFHVSVLTSPFPFFCVRSQDFRKSLQYTRVRKK